MKLENTYFLTQIFAGIAVVFSLIFVGVSVRQNTAAIRSQELAGMFQQSQARQLMIMSSDFSTVYTKALYKPDELTIDELSRANSYVTYRLADLKRAYLSYLAGITEQEDWEAQLWNVPIFLGSGFGRALWEDLRNDYSNNPDFIAEVERALATSPIVPDDEYLLKLHNRFQNL